MLTENTMGGGLSAADVAAVMNGRGNNGFGWGADGGWWILLLLLFAMNGGNWSNGGMGGGGYMPFMIGNTQADMQRGFDQQATQGTLAGIQAQIGNGFSDAAVARCNAQTSLLQAMNNNQNATTQGMNSLAMALQQCCCENRAATADLKYTVAQEACNTRQTISDGFRDVIAGNAANTQKIMDKLCQLELDGFKQKVADQATEIASLRNAISQTAQTAALIQNNEAQTANLLQRLNPNPVPAYMVQNPNCCAPMNYGCGCGA